MVNINRNLFYTVIYKVQITFQQGCKMRKTPTEHYVQVITKILHDAENVQCSILGLTELTFNPKCRSFQNSVCACLKKCKRIKQWLFIAHGSITFKPWLSIKVFLPGVFGN